MRSRHRVTFDTPLTPDRVVAALTDFSDARPAIWRGLNPDKYQVCELGDTWAVVEEGTARPDIFVRERYDWSTPGRVSWRLEQSNVFVPGSRIVASVSAKPDGGSRVEIDGVRIATSPVGYLVVAYLAVFGKSFVLSNYKATFDRLAQAGAVAADATPADRATGDAGG